MIKNERNKINFKLDSEMKKRDTKIVIDILFKRQ